MSGQAEVLQQSLGGVGCPETWVWTQPSAHGSLACTGASVDGLTLRKHCIRLSQLFECVCVCVHWCTHMTWSWCWAIPAIHPGACWVWHTVEHHQRSPAVSLRWALPSYTQLMRSTHKTKGYKNEQKKKIMSIMPPSPKKAIYQVPRIIMITIGAYFALPVLCWQQVMCRLKETWLMSMTMMSWAGCGLQPYAHLK